MVCLGTRIRPGALFFCLGWNLVMWRAYVAHFWVGALTPRAQLRPGPPLCEWGYTEVSHLQCESCWQVLASRSESSATMVSRIAD